MGTEIQEIDVHILHASRQATIVSPLFSLHHSWLDSRTTQAHKTTAQQLAYCRLPAEKAIAPQRYFPAPLVPREHPSWPSLP